MMQRPKARILLFGYLPPPLFGPSVACQTLLGTEFATNFKITFFNLSVVTNLSELEQVSVWKMIRLVGFVFKELWYLCTRRFDFCCYPISFNRNAFLKDALLLRLAHAFHVPIVLWAHGNKLPSFYARSGMGMQRLIDRVVCDARAAIVLGDRLRYNFEQHLRSEQIFTVPLGIRPPGILPAVEKRADTVSVLYLGNLAAEKGVLVLMRAIPTVVKRRPNARFVFSGLWRRDHERQEAERIISEHNLEGRIQFAGIVAGEAKWRLLAGADILVFPTLLSESFGLVLVEGMAAGLPIVTTPHVPIPDVIEDGVNGFVVDERDPDQLANKILQLADDPDLRRRIGEANRQKFERLYTAEHYGRRMIELFEKLARQPRG